MIAGALFGASNLLAPKNPAFLRRIELNSLAAMAHGMLLARVASSEAAFLRMRGISV